MRNILNPVASVALRSAHVPPPPPKSREPARAVADAGRHGHHERGPPARQVSLVRAGTDGGRHGRRPAWARAGTLTGTDAGRHGLGPSQTRGVSGRGAVAASLLRADTIATIAGHHYCGPAVLQAIPIAGRHRGLKAQAPDDARKRERRQARAGPGRAGLGRAEPGRAASAVHPRQAAPLRAAGRPCAGGGITTLEDIAPAV